MFVLYFVYLAAALATLGLGAVVPRDTTVSYSRQPVPSLLSVQHRIPRDQPACPYTCKPWPTTSEPCFQVAWATDCDTNSYTLTLGPFTGCKSTGLLSWLATCGSAGSTAQVIRDAADASRTTPECVSNVCTNLTVTDIVTISGVFGPVHIRIHDGQMGLSSGDSNATDCPGQPGKSGDNGGGKCTGSCDYVLDPTGDFGNCGGSPPVPPTLSIAATPTWTRSVAVDWHIAKGVTDDWASSSIAFSPSIAKTVTDTGDHRSEFLYGVAIGASATDTSSCTVRGGGTISAGGQAQMVTSLTISDSQACNFTNYPSGVCRFLPTNPPRLLCF